MKTYDSKKNYCTNFISHLGGCWWNKCCYFHDKCYEKSGIDRKSCDEDFRDCIKNKNCFFARFLAPVMYLFVRTFGHKYYKRKQILIKIRKFKERKTKNERSE